MLSDWELWACANEAIVQHGDRAAFIAAVRVAELSHEGDLSGAEAWRGIASRVEALTAGAVGPTH
ncbi:DUF6961 family protein [Sphingosinicella sp. LY1275]|uniref:DUF6961 family protein n=1 Tax=Sphingosinicella sp. LY1275 TaxID=3095379 RepID=UPI003A0FF12B